METMLEKLAQKRDDLLLGEVAALLHQMAKYSRHFIQSQLLGGPIFSNFHAVPPSELDDTFVDSTVLSNWKQDRNPNLWELLSNAQKSAIRHMPSFKLLMTHEEYSLLQILAVWHRKDRQRGRNLPFTGSFAWIVSRTGYPIWLLDACHGIAHVEKAEIFNLDDADKPNAIGLTSAFGLKWVLLESTNEGQYGKPTLDLNSRIREFDFGTIVMSPKGLRNHILSEGKRFFTQTVAETTAPANEVTLWEWHWMTAALYKSALTAIEIGAVSPPYPIKQTEWSWRTLRITVDVLGLLGKAHRISDLLGYRQKIERFFAFLKELVEERYPLGNEIFRDSTGIYFTFPAIADFEEIEYDIRERAARLAYVMECVELAPLVQVGNESWGEHPEPNSPTNPPQWADAPKMLKTSIKASQDAITSGNWGTHRALYSAWHNNLPSSQQAEICPVCGIRPMIPFTQHSTYRRQRCNTCVARAAGSLNTWTAEAAKKEPTETIWLDEIADQHDRVALIVGRFQLDRWLDGSLITTLAGSVPQNGQAQTKQPSPARIMRVWRTTEEFWSKSVADLLRQVENRERKVVEVEWDEGNTPTPEEHVLDGTVNGTPISLFSYKQQWLTIMNPQITGDNLKPGNVVRVRQDNGRVRTGKIKGQPARSETLATYQPTRTIFASPDQFMALVPGADALNIAQQIAEQYGREMGKVRSRLPLDLALVYFHRKMPLYAVIDAARRFLMQKPTKDEKWKVQGTPCLDKNAKGDVIQVGVSFQDEKQCPIGSWRVSTSFGDGSPDPFYPYVASNQTKQGYNYEANGDKYIHLAKLEPDDVIKVAPSHFSYLWLDSSARRYDAGFVDSDAPLATQNVPIEEISWLVQTWAKMQEKGITNTKLHGVVEMLLEKRTEWQPKGEASAEEHQRSDEIFVRFAEDVLLRQGIHGIVFREVDDKNMSSQGKLVYIKRFLRCFDLHYRVMRARLKPTNTTVSENGTPSANKGAITQ